MFSITSKFDRKKIITSLEINLNTPVVVLNDDWSSATHRFIEANDLIPCLRTRNNAKISSNIEINKELTFEYTRSIIDFSKQINNGTSCCGLLSSDISKLLHANLFCCWFFERKRSWIFN